MSFHPQPTRFADQHAAQSLLTQRTTELPGRAARAEAKQLVATRPRAGRFFAGGLLLMALAPGRSLRRRFVRRRLSTSTPLPVTPALFTSASSALLGSPIPPSRLPTRPAPRRRPTRRTAVARKRMAGTKTPLAALQQTAPAARPAARAKRSDTVLMRRLFRKMLGWAHGRFASPERSSLGVERQTPTPRRFLIVGQ